MSISTKTPKSRSEALNAAETYVDTGGFFQDLATLVAVRTESFQKNSESETASDDHAAKEHYLQTTIASKLAAQGFDSTFFPNPDPEAGPLALYTRQEGEHLPTVLMYGHADVIPGLDDQWDDGRSPWVLDEADGKLFGRGTADNKGQHWINICALREVINARGHLGFNCKILLESDEEAGSRGLERFCEDNRTLLAADVLIASDGPRVRTERPTIALGSRGNMNFDLSLRYRSSGRHSGNWGGILKDPGLRLSHAIASIADSRGQILIEGWRPDQPSKAVQELLKGLSIQSDLDDEKLDTDWGELGLTPAERLFAWNSFAVLAMKTGFPEKPVNAIAPSAWARCQLRFVAGLDPDDILPILRQHLDDNGFEDVELTMARSTCWRGTTTDPDNDWVRSVTTSIGTTTGQTPDVIPAIGGSLPNHAFANLVGMPTIWLPHSYKHCSQHAPNEHLRLDLARDALKIMTGLFWDIGDQL